VKLDRSLNTKDTKDTKRTKDTKDTKDTGDQETRRILVFKKYTWGADASLLFFKSINITSYTRDYELVPSSFTIAPGVVVPIGRYSYEAGRVSYALGQEL